MGVSASLEESKHDDDVAIFTSLYERAVEGDSGILKALTFAPTARSPLGLPKSKL